MFADISGFTAMSEKMDPEQVTCTMNDCFCMMEECINSHGGTVDKFIGDCVMVLFGVPKALEDAPQKAVNTAIELRNRLYKFNGEKNLAIPLNVHIGINTGPVVAGMVGGSEKQDFTVMGDTVNLASRIEGVSQVGQILVGPATYKATKAGFKYKALQPVSLKGKSEPVPVYELLSVKETLSRMQPGVDRMISSAMVGRDNELNKLEFQIMKAINGEGSIVNVIGEAGIGKSRLIAELKNSTVLKKVTLLEGRAISMGSNLGYHLIIDLLKNWAQITEEDSEVAAFTKLESAIRTIYPEALGEILPFVATLMGIKLVGRYAERMKDIAGESLEKLILKNVRDLITRGTQGAPLVIILEDLHWADTSSIDLMEPLFRLASKERIVFINVFRPGYAETGDRVIKTTQENYPDKYTEIMLQPLDEKQTETLITNLLNIKGFPHKLKEQIIQRAGGNPYFIEEVIRSFIDEGAVVIKGEGFEVTDRLATMSIPRTINEVLMARIDRLDQKTRDLVKTASVIGRNFFYRILAEVAKTIEDMDSRLEYLEEIQLIRERKRMEELEYLFKHALAQEVTYDSILVQRRKELHKNVADSIEKVFSERLSDFYGMLAFHYSQAEDLDKTEEYLIKAGEESLKSSASAEALHYYQQALDLYLRKYGDKADPKKVAMLEKNIALSLYNRGQYTECVPYFDKVLAFYDEIIPRHKIARVLKLGVGILSSVSALYLPYLHWKKDPTQEDNEFFILYYKKLGALVLTDPEEWLFQAFYFYIPFTKIDFTKMDTGPGLASILVILFALTGLSFTVSRRVLTFTKNKVDVADVRSMLFYQSNVLYHNGLSGEWKDEFKIDQDLIDKNIAIGEFFYVTVYMYLAIFMHNERGNYKVSLSLIQKLSDIGETYENDYPKVVKFLHNGTLLMGYRKLHEAMNEIQEGILFTERTGFRVQVINMYALKAKTHLLLGDFNGAEDSLVQADKFMSEMVVVPMYVAYFFLIRFVLDMYLLEETTKKADKVTIKKYRSKAISSGTKSLKVANKFSFTKIETFKLMGVYYWTIGKQRKAMKWWHTAISEGQRMNYRLELSRVYYEVGKRLLEPKSKYKELDGIKADEYLEKARVMFEEMDLQWDLDELEKLRLHMGH